MRILVELFFLQGGKEASHSCVVKAVARTNQVLLYSVSVQHISEALAGILAASVAVHIAPLRLEYLVCSCSTVAIQSSFFMLFCISRVTISPLNQFMMCEIYNFPSAHGNSEMLFKNFSSGAFAVKLRFMRFSSSCTSVVAFVIPCSMCRLCSRCISIAKPQQGGFDVRMIGFLSRIGHVVSYGVYFLSVDWIAGNCGISVACSTRAGTFKTV